MLSVFVCLCVSAFLSLPLRLERLHQQLGSLSESLVAAPTEMRTGAFLAYVDVLSKV